MSDLTTESGWWCRSNVCWEHRVSGSKGNSYLVKWERIFDRRISDAEFGWTCECPAFEWHPGRQCKHISGCLKLRCAWNSEMDASMVPDGGLGDRKCPSCGGPVEGFRVAT